MAREDRRLLLHEELERVLGSDQVYYQTPTGRKMHYPAIVYSNSTGDYKYADNRIYSYVDSYSVTLIIDDVTTDIMLKMLNHFYLIKPDGNPYISDGLYHYPFLLYY